MKKRGRVFLLIVILLVIFVEGLELINISGITGYRVSLDKIDGFKIILNVEQLD